MADSPKYGSTEPYIPKMKQILDKISIIFRFFKELSSKTVRNIKTKAHIGLTIALYSVKHVFVYMALLIPLTASAGVFSFISDLIGKEADAEVRTSFQYLGVLQAHVGPGSTSPVGGGEIQIVEGGALIQEAGVIGTQADLTEARSTQISIYVVRKGDSLSQIAQMYDVTVNTIKWSNSITGAIKEGDELIILPISGVSHTIKKGDTARSIATKYKASLDDILSYNNIKVTDTLEIGSILIVPDGEVQASPVVASGKVTSKLRNAGGPVYKDFYIRPIEGGARTQGLHGLNGVDLAAPVGTPIRASAGGVVIISRSSGYNGGYGSYVVISHSNGTQTLYAHMNKVQAIQGTTVAQGELIGTVGSTGKSTGPHVHFEVRGAANPF